MQQKVAQVTDGAENIVSDGPTTVLLVDDDSSVRQSLRWMLEAQGYKSLEAEDGSSAIRILGCRPVDVVVLDLLMPHMDGIEALLQVRKRWPSVKVVTISGGGMCSGPDVSLEMTRRLGAVRAMAKPFSAEALAAAVKEALQK